jgi:hypothetical protein
MEGEMLAQEPQKSTIEHSLPKNVLFSSHFIQEGSNETKIWKQNIGRYITNKNSTSHFRGENSRCRHQGATKVASKSRHAFKGPPVKVRLM